MLPRNEPEQASPLVVAGATIPVSSSRPARAELWVQDGVITYVGRDREVRPAGSCLVDAQGASIVPLVVGSADRRGREVPPTTNELVPGAPGTFAVTTSRVGPRAFETWMIIRPADLVMVVVAGHVMAWRGEPTAASGPEAPSWCGTWADDSHALEQHLLPGGRYSETRHGRADAYTGSYWTCGAHIVYLDDSGFWAFGERSGDVLYHADFVMTRRTTRQ
ncbi:hypothetical protein D9V41_09565 [Aeromicrobium phragmitis]|uniref:Uncharacterized protein n=1 Tax=Aeromicrobium phragmitis TaxID=2478914 RepID=A0A3L8PNY2_9ACTN|nr:Atu4866 domain-containing protein [Aeromicrobium phragmitis]RLV55702.1 hypothetical protein D9V41_09565 [Aeromicrobium phragmitis]